MRNYLRRYFSYTNSNPKTKVLVWNEFTAIGRPVIGLRANSTHCDGRDWYSPVALMLA